MNDPDSTVAKQKRGPIEWMRWIPVVLLAILLLVAIAIGARIILVPLLSSLALTYLLAPIVAWFEHRGWSRQASVLLTMTTATLSLVLILIFILPSFWNQLSKSYAQAQNLLAKDRINSLQTKLETKLEKINPDLPKLIKNRIEHLDDQPERITNFVMGWLQRGLFRLVDLTTSILDLLLIPFFVYYLLVDYGAMRARLDRLIPPRFRGVTSELLGRINNVISSYIQNQLLIALVMGALYSLGFLALRVPLAVMIGMLSGILNFVPYLGTLIGLVLSLVFAALDGAGIVRLIGVLIVFAIVQSVEGYYLTPKLLGSRLDLHPMWVLVGLMIGGSLFGLLGIILAVPIIAIAKVVLGFLEELYQQTDFYRSSGVSLLTYQGRQVELAESALPRSLTDPTGPQGVILEETQSNTSRRTIITTAELRSRIRDSKPESDD